jgi:peroxiredoxin family protein
VLILGTTGAASGMEVDIFFTFWGLRVLQRNDKRVTGTNWMQKGESIVDRGGSDHLKLGKINFAGAGTAMIKKLATDYKREDFIDGLGPSMGAASFLDIAADADITLFI